MQTVTTENLLQKVEALEKHLMESKVQLNNTLHDKLRNEEILHEKNRELEVAKSFLQNIMDSSVDYIVTFDKNFNITSLNSNAVAFLGRPKEELIGKNQFELVPAFKGTRVEENILKALSGVTVHEQNAKSIHRPGTYIDSYYIPLTIDGKVEGVLAINKDISETVTASEQLKQVNDQLAQAQQIAHIGSWEWSVIENKITWSDELYRIYGVDKESFKADYENYVSFTHPDDRQLVNEAVQKAIKKHTPFNFYHRITRRDGQIRILNGKGKVVIDENGSVIRLTGTAQDVTEFKLAEEKILDINENLALKNQELTRINTELTETKNFINSVLESSQHGVLSYKPVKENDEIVDFEITYANEIALQQINMTAEQIIGKSYLTIVPIAKKTGSYDRIKRVLTTGVSETREINSPNYPNRWFLAHYVSLNNGVTVTFIEVTDQKKQAREIEEKNLQLERSNAELASFSYIASHDLKEPLRKMQMFTNRILEQDYETLSDKSKEYFQRIINSSKRMDDLIIALLNYSRTNNAEVEFTHVDINIVIAEIKNNLHELLDENKVELEVEQMPVIYGVPHQITQLFSNIITNAVKYRSEKRQPRIKISYKEVSQEGLLKSDIMGVEKYCKIIIEDNGIGFEQEYAEKIFELFQRLHNKDEYEGTGIGLSICKKIVQNHGGMITAAGNPDQGSTFIVYFPVL